MELEDKIYKITLTDGTVLDNLRLSGTNFVSGEPLDPAIFKDNCSGVVISDGETEEMHPAMEYVPTAQTETDKFRFTLRDLTEQELREMRRDANIEYLAMMTGVEL